MDNLKPKEPLLAVMLGVIMFGLGQIYAGKVKRGIIFFCIPLILGILLMLYILNPNTTTNLPFAAILFIFSFGYGLFVIIDGYQCAKAYNINNGLNYNVIGGKKVLLILGIIFFTFIFNPSIIITQIIKDNIVQAFKVPTHSMEPTLMKGDLVLADKAIYRKSEPKRGDLIVFAYTKGTKKIFLKRLVGLPNETIEIKNGKILIDGTILNEKIFANNSYYNKGEYAKEGQSVKISADSYFVLGDNSASSQDSRDFGFVPKKDIVGKAYKIYYPFERSGVIR